MATTPLTPRQKMINMLYLVLTAILALNVSSEVLDAFKSVNDGISISNYSQQSKNAAIFSDIKEQFIIDSVRASHAYTKVQKAREISGKLNTLLEQYKQQMIKEAGGIDPETGKIKRDDDIDVPTRIFVEDNGKRGKELKQQILDARKQLIELLPEADRKAAEKSLALNIDDSANGTAWEFAKFNHIPVVAAVTLLTKFQNDLYNAEGHVMQQLFTSINSDLTTIDRMEAKIISPSSYVLQGEQYNADVMVAASNTSLEPEVFLGSFTGDVKRNGTSFIPIKSSSDKLPLVNPVKVDVANGLGKLSMGGNSIGNKKYTGVIRVKNSQTGNYDFYPFEGEYQVAPKIAVVSPQKMNVLYIGLDNPVDISVPGIAQSDVIAEFVGDGKLEKNSDGSYRALVANQGNTKIKISAKVNGKVMPMGEKTFRIKRIPDPQTTVDGLPPSSNATVTFLTQRGGVVAKSPEFIYGDLPWKVQKFTVTIRMGTDVIPIENVGPVFSKKVKDLLPALKKGDAMFIDDVMVMGPDNKLRKIAPLSFLVTGK